MRDKKGIIPVIATSLLIVVAVVAILSFQTWFQYFQTGINTHIETKSSNSITDNIIQSLIGKTLYLKNDENNNITITSIKINNKNCNISKNLTTGITELNVSLCTINITTSTPDIVVFTKKKIYSKKIYVNPVNYIQRISFAKPISPWTHRYNITFNTPTTINNYQVNVTLNPSNFNYGYSLGINGSDLRFYSSKNSPLSYFVETWNTTGTSTIWVKVANQGAKNIYMDIGDSSAQTLSNPYSTYDFYENFSNTLNTSKWSIISSNGVYTMYPNYIHIQSGTHSGNKEVLYAKNYSMTHNSIMEIYSWGNGGYTAGSSYISTMRGNLARPFDNGGNMGIVIGSTLPIATTISYSNYTTQYYNASSNQTMGCNVNNQCTPSDINSWVLSGTNTSVPEFFVFEHSGQGANPQLNINYIRIRKWVTNPPVASLSLIQ